MRPVTAAERGQILRVATSDIIGMRCGCPRGIEILATHEILDGEIVSIVECQGCFAMWLWGKP